MAPRPRWWHQLQASKHEALLAVDLYNRSGNERQLEAFVVHMMLAWQKLLQAVFERDGRELYERDARGRRKKTAEGDYFMRPLRSLLDEAYPAGDDPRRKNVEFFLGLRHKIEHRHDRDVAAFVAGKSQALVLNYERALESAFGATEGLASQLRFPVFVSSVTDDAVDAIRNVRRRIPKAVLEYVEDFDAALDPALAGDLAYDFRITLIPRTGPKSSADVALTFVRLDDLTDDDRALMERVQTIVRERLVPVADLGSMLPTEVAQRVETMLGVRFGVYEHSRAWKAYEVRPPEGANHPEVTKTEFCTWSSAFRQYTYTDRWVPYLARRLADPLEFERVVGRPPRAISG